MLSVLSKDLVAASATPLVLGILAGGDSYGYAIIRDIRDRSRGTLEWTEGMLYPVLHRLEAQGLVVARWEGEEGERRRKYYRITDEGRAALAALLAQWRAVDEAVEAIAGGKRDVRT